jgi:hypothetical protein
MSNRYAGVVHIVAANADGTTEYWAAACTQGKAVALVRLMAPPGRTFALTDKRLTRGQIWKLSLRLNQVKQIPYVP